MSRSKHAVEMWGIAKERRFPHPTARRLRGIYTDISKGRVPLSFLMSSNRSRSARKSHLPAQKKCLSNPQGAWSPAEPRIQRGYVLELVRHRAVVEVV